MTADQLAAEIEAAVGRGRWFIPRDMPVWAAGQGQTWPHALETLQCHGRIARRTLALNDARRQTSARYEYLLR